MDRGTWQATGHGVAKNGTQMSNTHTHAVPEQLTFHTHTFIEIHTHTHSHNISLQPMELPNMAQVLHTSPFSGQLHTDCTT